MKDLKICLLLAALPLLSLESCDPENTGGPGELSYAFSWHNPTPVEGSLSATGAQLKASYSINLATDLTEEAGVAYSMAGDSEATEQFAVADGYVRGERSFTVTLSGLKPATGYITRIYAKSGGKIYYSTTTRTFTTTDGAFDYAFTWVDPSPVEGSLSSTGATLRASYSTGLPEDLTEEAGVAYRAANDPESAEIEVSAEGYVRAEQAFSVVLSGLKPATAYTARIYAKSDGKMYYSTVTRTFTTLADGTDDPYQISVGTPAAADIKYNSVRLSGSWTLSGEGTVTQVGFKYKKDGDTQWGTLTSSGTSNPCYYTWTAANGGLEASSTYQVAFWVKVGDKTHESAGTVTFTTPEEPVTPPPTDQALWGELPTMKQATGVYYVTHFVNSAGTKIATPTEAGRVRSYSIAYDSNDFKTLWVAAPMHAWYDGSSGRTDAWGYDPYIPQNLQPNLKSSYEAVGDGAFSRGHLVASSDRLKSSAMNTQTFYYTNMAPQVQTRFNDGIWNQLEIKVQDWGNACSDTLYVVTGLIYEGTKRTSDGNGKILPVPSHFYKALISSKKGNTGKKLSELSASDLRCVGFLFPNASTTDKISSKYMVKVSDIEARVGYEFFPMLSQSAASVKSSYTAGDWGM